MSRGSARGYDEHCEGKVSFLDRAKAEFAALTMRRRKRYKVHAYRCRKCSSWHVGGSRRRTLNLRSQARSWAWPLSCLSSRGGWR